MTKQIYKSPRQCGQGLHPATMLLSISVFVSALLAGASASNVLDLVPDNFDSIVGQGTPALVELCVLSMRKPLVACN